MKIIYQVDSSDCGPACVAMVAAHFGKRVSLTKMRYLAGTDRRGTNLNGIVAAAEAVDLDVCSHAFYRF